MIVLILLWLKICLIEPFFLKKVGFTFVAPYSPKLFDNKNVVAVKDLENNPEASLMFPLQGSWAETFFCQVVVGAVLAQPALATRTSEEVLSKAILSFHKMHHDVPLGISEEVLEKWASKMAYGLAAMASKFKRLLWTSGEKAKSKKILKMKQLYWTHKPNLDMECGDKGGVDATEVLEKSGFDWGALEKKLQAALASKQALVKMPEPKVSKASSCESSASSSSLVKCPEKKDTVEKYILPSYVLALLVIEF